MIEQNKLSEEVREGQDARNVLLRMVANFPGLVLESNYVSGADVVEWITNELFQLSTKGSSWNKELVEWAENGSPCEECGERASNCDC